MSLIDFILMSAIPLPTQLYSSGLCLYLYKVDLIILKSVSKPFVDMLQLGQNSKKTHKFLKNGTKCKSQKL